MAEVSEVAGGSTGLGEGVGIGSSIGSSGFVSCIDLTIFSRSTGVMCFSRPRLLLLVESCLRSSGRALEARGRDDVSSSNSSEETESRLVESAGMLRMLAALGLLGAKEQRRDSVDRA